MSVIGIELSRRKVYVDSSSLPQPKHVYAAQGLTYWHQIQRVRIEDMHELMDLEVEILNGPMTYGWHNKVMATSNLDALVVKHSGEIYMGKFARALSIERMNRKYVFARNINVSMAEAVPFVTHPDDFEEMHIGRRIQYGTISDREISELYRVLLMYKQRINGYH